MPNKLDQLQKTTTEARAQVREELQRTHDKMSERIERMKERVDRRREPRASLQVPR